MTNVTASDINNTDTQAISTADIMVDDISDSGNNELLKTENNDSAGETLSAESNNEKLSASSIDVTTYSGLSSAIENSAYSEINIMNDITFTSVLSIDRSNFVINGNGYTLNGQNSYSFFKSTGYTNITFKNINFINGYWYSSSSSTGGGGCLYLYTCHDILIDNCNFSDSKSLGSSTRSAGCAAGIWMDYVNDITINKCNFNNMYGMRHGAALYFDKSAYNININNSNFYNCYAEGSGGAINFHAKTTMYSS